MLKLALIALAVWELLNLVLLLKWVIRRETKVLRFGPKDLWQLAPFVAFAWLAIYLLQEVPR